jgi:flagellar biosynthesis protein FlhG
VKTLDVQNHYEVLEVPPGARLDEIERAYRLATSTWSEGSLALYSLFDENDAGAVRERINQAYRVLSDERSRRAYDSATFETLPEPEPAVAPAGQGAELSSLEEEYDDMEISLDSALEGKVEGVEGEAGETEYDGARLRRARMHRGIELDDIGQVTKVTLSYLHAIEDEAFDSLPAAVYVRGFVTAYARAIGLDPDRVARSFMPRLEAARQGRGRGRLLGRR